MRIRLTLDIQRARRRRSATTAPDVDTKTTADLERAPQTDFEPPHRVGFLRNQESAS